MKGLSSRACGKTLTHFTHWLLSAQGDHTHEASWRRRGGRSGERGGPSGTAPGNSLPSPCMKLTVARRDRSRGRGHGRLHLRCARGGAGERRWGLDEISGSFASCWGSATRSHHPVCAASKGPFRYRLCELERVDGFAHAIRRLHQSGLFPWAQVVLNHLLQPSSA